jgi:hypothetical protein
MRAATSRVFVLDPTGRLLVFERTCWHRPTTADHNLRKNAKISCTNRSLHSGFVSA